MSSNRCVSCGTVIPEGRQVCPNCEMATEKRLIDANALDALENLDYDYAPVRDGCAWYRAADVWACIESEPTVDAVEVVHGEWEKQQGIYSCSICGKACPYDVQADIIQYWACNYCPNCGAKMDGEGRTNERKAD